MNLIEESFQNKKADNSKKIARIILIVIAILIILIIGIVSYLVYVQNNTLRLSIDGQANEKVKQMLVFESDGTIYVPIREIATYLGYQSYRGEYNRESEDVNKCYIQSEDEIANFTLNSKKIYKLSMEANADYEYFYMKQPVKAMNGVLYTTTEGLEKAFNVSFHYDEAKKQINIYTLPYLIKSYEAKVLDYGYESISKSFTNQKTILDSLLVVQKGNTYGVIDVKGNAILEPKYKDIKYMPNIGDFLVTGSSSTVGVMAKTGETKIDLLYDNLALMDSDVGLYVAKKDGKYGVLDVKGNIKIYVEYDEIGINISNFAQNDIKNKYLLVDNLIPVRKDKKWGLYDKNGKQVVDFMYDRFGYIASSNKNAVNNLLIIPDYNLIVACKDKKYNLVNSSGEPQLGKEPVVDDIYMQITGGQKYYYMNFRDNTLNVEEYLDRIGVKSTKKSTTITENNNVSTINNMTSNKTNTSN